jgi:hypothetical protein
MKVLVSLRVQCRHCLRSSVYHNLSATWGHLPFIWRDRGDGGERNSPAAIFDSYRTQSRKGPSACFVKKSCLKEVCLFKLQSINSGGLMMKFLFCNV